MDDERGLTQEDVSNMIGDGAWETIDGPAWRTFRDLKAENERLREALEQIATGDGVYGQQAHEYKKIARAALATPDHTAG